MENDTKMEEYADRGTVLVDEEHFFAAVDMRFIPANRAETIVAEPPPKAETADQGLSFPGGDTGGEEEFHPALDEAEFDAALRDHASERFGDQGLRDSQPMEAAEMQGGEDRAIEEGGENVVETKGGGIGNEGKLSDGRAEERPNFEGGLERGSTGVGRPYSPAGWQWKVGSTSRVTAAGHYSDVSRTPPNGEKLSSMKQVECYMRDKLGLSETEVKDCLKTFEARIPATREVVESEKGFPPEKETVPADPPEEAVDNANEGLMISPQNVVYEEDEEEADEDEDEDEHNSVTLDEFLKSPENWPSIGWRLRGPEGKLQLKQLLSEARSRESTPEASLKRLKLRLLKFPAFLRSEELEILPNSLLTLVALVMTEGVVYEAKSRKMLNGELIMIIRDELTKHQKAAGLDELGVELKSKEKKSKKVQTNEAGPGRKRKNQAPAEEEAAPKRKRKSVNDLPGKPEPFLVKRVVQLKPSLSGLSVEVDDDDSEEETVEQAVPRLMTPEAATDALNAALEAAAETPPQGGAPGISQPPPSEAGPAFASPLFFADQNLSEESVRIGGSAPGNIQVAPLPPVEPPLPPAAPPPPQLKALPMTVEQREIVVYRRKLVKLERKRKQWEQAFDQKLGAYKAKREGLEQQLEKRRTDQEEQKIKVVQETEKLRELRNTALQEMRALQAVGNLADTAEQELEKRGGWEAIYTTAIDEVKKAKKKAWEDMKKGVGEVKRSNLEQMRKKVDAYKQLGMALPQSDIELEREQYTAEITEMQAKLEAQKVILDAEVSDLEQKMTAAKAAYNDFKAQHKKLEREEVYLQQLLQEPIRG